MRSILLSALILVSVSLYAQHGVPFNGLIVDGAGNPLKGARFWVSDRSRYTMSDKQGRFGLTDVEDTDSIHLRYAKRTYSIAVDGMKSMKIIMTDANVSSVDEDQNLINMGYGYVKRRENSGSGSRIYGDELEKSGKTDLLECLKGRVAGLSVSGGMVPGSEASTTIRGISSFNLTTKPLYVLDGIVVEDIRGVNPSDVYYVEVLKDASIYGSRGANGAILITTKKGNRK